MNSGCVTSAETVLISQQSGDEFLRALGGSKDSKAVVMALSPQSLASLAVHFDVDMVTTYKCFKAFFHKLSAEVVASSSSSSSSSSTPPLPVYVYSTSAASNISLIESAAEFVSRFRNSQDPVGAAAGATSTASWEAPPASRALSATHDSLNVLGGAQPETRVPALETKHVALPMLTSACPGWICYAEKTTPASIPYLSTTKSPQQVNNEFGRIFLADDTSILDLFSFPPNPKYRLPGP